MHVHRCLSLIRDNSEKTVPDNLQGKMLDCLNEFTVPALSSRSVKATIELPLAPSDADTEAIQYTIAAEQLGIEEERISAVRALKRSIDARHQPVLVRLKVDVYYDEPAPPHNLPTPDYPEVTDNKRVIIVGAGPAGMFAALRLIELGIKP